MKDTDTIALAAAHSDRRHLLECRELLLRARTKADMACAPGTLNKIRSALKSCEGAIAHRNGLIARFSTR